MSKINIPEIKVHDGNQIPQLGLGTFLIEKEHCEKAVLNAFEVGYRHIDTAAIYRNEKEVGLAIANSGLDRADIFLTTKLWNNEQTDPHGGFARSLERLGQEYVDLYLLHWPLPKRDTAIDAWKGIAQIAESGRAKSVGVCNFEVEHLEKLIAETGVVPVVNQIELHPEHQRQELVDYCREQNIAVEAWGPLAQRKSDLLEKEEVVTAAKELDRTPAQIVLRWSVQRGNIVIPKTVNRDRMQENLNIFDFELSQATMDAFKALDTVSNYGPDPRQYDTV